jgi:hypothetical protein
MNQPSTTIRNEETKMNNNNTKIIHGALFLAVLWLSACSSGGSGDVTTAYKIGGTVTGLGAGKSVVLQNNGGNNLTLSADGVFNFTTSVANSATYNVTVLTQPAVQTCTVANASGTVSGSPVTNVTVTCVVSVALAKTGQATCYDPSAASLPPDTVVACTGTRQDGDLQKGVAAAPQRFVPGINTACITDTLTGLMWVSTPSLTGSTWANALTNSNLNLCGFTDWRLPNRAELGSLLNYSVTDNAAVLNASGFANIAGWYWSSTTNAGIPANAWVVGITNGQVLSAAKSVTYPYTWPVRGP